MTLKTPEQEVEISEDIFEGLQNTIRAMRCEFEDLKEQVQSGEEINETAAGKKLGSISGLMTQCLKAENTLNECRNRQAGIARGGYALDLEQARIEIGCKLDKLRCTAYPV